MHTPAPNQFTPATAEDVEVVLNSTNSNARDIDVELANRSTGAGDVNISSANNLQTTEHVNLNSTNNVYKGMKSTIGVVTFISLGASVLVVGGYGIEASKSKSTQIQTNFSESDCVVTKAPSVVKAKSTKSPSSKTRSPTLSKSSKKKRRRCGKSTKAPSPSPTKSLSPSLSPSIKPSELPSELPSSRPSIQPSTSTQPSDQPSLFPSASVEPSMAPSELPSSSSRPSNQPSTQPSDEPSLFPSASAEPSMTPSCLSQPPPNCAQLYGGGWTRVRHVPAGITWHPATDSLAGTEVYGTESIDSAPWSVDFESKVAGYNEFLFATGDCTKWLVATTDAVIGETYGSASRPILASSDNASPYSAVWLNRANQVEDPWVSIIDHVPAIGAGKILYGENGYGGAHSANILPSSAGADVYVRVSTACISC
ncbi:hypothetical protein QTG54_006727 [Skeletonema marinoi]|uniref:Uncharacterized protein n=1 Tax=Skeletonema marinoi TaxID=267567 RepID=A0AAD8YB01_9STRA|nr:hypothetical protein QTG54_006727 [Skeletonema marinoi]